MFNWLREWYQVQQEYHNCKSCEVLKIEIERLTRENSRMLDRILEPKVIESTVSNEPTAVLPNKHIPWAVRRQALEAEDRERARILSKAPQPSINDLEKELGIEPISSVNQ